MKRITLVLALIGALCGSSAAPLLGQKTLVRWADAAAAARVESASPGLVFDATGGVLRVRADGGGKHALSIVLPEGGRDASAGTSLHIPAANVGGAECLVSARLNDKRWVAAAAVLSPGDVEDLEIVFLHPVDKTALPFANMDGVPGGGLYIWDPVDPANLEAVRIEIACAGPAEVSIGDIQARGEYRTGEQAAADPGFFPFIDEYGQYKHGDWPGKVRSGADLDRNLRAELAEIALLKEPAGLDEYGGWAAGPQLAATGHFRVQKVDGAWWLVDPNGRLFWSHGVNCAGFGSGTTEASGRERFFASLPGPGGRVNFYAANLARKFGGEWRDRSIRHIHDRLRSWGMNTVANWSDPAVYLSAAHRTPYTVDVAYRPPALDGAAYKFPDVFDPRFAEALEAGVRRAVEKTVGDSRCIGYFIDNELYLGDYGRLPAVVMKQAPDGAAKLALIGHLKTRFGAIAGFNDACGTAHGSWEALAAETTLPEAGVEAAAAFNRIIVDKYYAACRSLIRKYAPHKLYLGNRFNLYRIYYPEVHLIDDVLRAAAAHCDVVSINYYRFTCEDLVLPDGLDRPILIGEFHFGALDRGLPHTGLRNVADQDRRAEMYRHYLDTALRNPLIVGAHWFQYGDEPYTGRFDGENYQIGLVDVCDTPYPETIAAVRTIGYSLYRLRSIHPGCVR